MPASPKSGPATTGGRVAFTGFLIGAMGAATLIVTSLGVLATFVIDDLGVSRAQVGGVVSVTAGLSAIGSPLVGRVTDALGGKRAFVLTLFASAAGLALMSLSVAYWLMFVAAAVAAFGQAGANPSTNKLIATHLRPGQRGTITGLKQSGVQVAIFLSGLVSPSVALVAGWRAAFAVLAIGPIVLVPLAIRFLPPDPLPVLQAPRPRGQRAPAVVWWLAAYGFLTGLGGAFTFLLPLFVEESLGRSPRVGGLAAAAVGLAAMLGRVVWARFAERSDRYALALGLIAVGAVGAVAMLAAATTWGIGALWIGVVMTGVTASSWNSVGMLAAIRLGGASTGGSSGVVMLGFLLGIAVGPPLMGWTVDSTGGYGAVWAIAAISLAAAAVVATLWSRRLGPV